MEDIRIGIIGHGFMGHEHEKMLTKMDGIRLIGFSDIDPKQLEESGLWHQPVYYRNGQPVERGTWLIYSKRTEKTDFVNAFIQLAENWFQ